MIVKTYADQLHAASRTAFAALEPLKLPIGFDV
jgi:hypothetical protein